MKKEIIVFWLLLCVGEFVVPYILGNRIANYNSLKMVMSAVGAKENGILSVIYRLWLIIYGSYTTYMLFRLRNLCTDRTFKIALVIIIIYAILGCILCGIFPSEMTKTFTTISAKIHAIAVVISFFLLMFVPILLGCTFLKKGNFLIFAISILAFICALAVFILQVVSERETYVMTFIGNTGLWERLYLCILYSYIGGVLLKLILEKTN